MPYGVAIPAIDTAIRARLAASAGLTALIATKPAARGGGPAVYEDGTVPQGALFPYLTIGLWTQVGFHNLSPDGNGYGWNCTGQIRAVGQKSEMQLLGVMNEVFAALPQGQRLTVTGYGSAWCDEFNLQPTLKTILGGMTTFEAPAILRVFVHDV